MLNVIEKELNIISKDTSLEGKLYFDQITRIHGTLKGEIIGNPGSTLIICENGTIEGKVKAEKLIVNGFIEGEIEASKKIIVSQTGKIIGKLKTPSLRLDYGSFFEGSCEMEKTVPNHLKISE